MPTPSLTPQTAPNYFYERGIDITDDAYQLDAALYPQFVNMVSEDEFPDFPYGGRGQGMAYDAEPREVEVGEAPEASRGTNDYTWQCKIRTFERFFTMSDDDLDAARRRGREAAFDKWLRTFTRQSQASRESFIAGMLQDGTLTAGSTQYFDNGYSGQTDPNAGFILDGLPWFDTAHTRVADSGTFSNHEATRALTAGNIDLTYTAMSVTNAVDQTGKRISLTPTHVVVPSALRGTLFQLLNAESLPGSANNDANPLRALNLQPLVHSFLTDDTDAWWMIDASAGSGVICYDSGRPDIRTWRDESRRATMVAARYRFGATVTDPRFAFACNKAAS